MWNSGGDMADEPRQEDAPRQRLAQSVGARVKAARKEQRMTLLELGRKCETTAQTIQRLEAASMTMSLDWLERICTALQIEPSELFISRDTPEWIVRRHLAHVRGEAEAVQVRAQALATSIGQLLEAADAVN
jgi:transcriptional regulator with XRE-family HTH domain